MNKIKCIFVGILVGAACGFFCFIWVSATFQLHFYNDWPMIITMVVGSIVGAIIGILIEQSGIEDLHSY